MTDKPLKDIHWHGDSLDIVREFPRPVRIDIGSELYLLQLGEKPVHSKPFASVGRGFWEVRIKDQSGAFRVFYVVRRRDGIHVLHAFQKKTQKTRKSDIELGKARYRELRRKR
jgi:phage-related protein